MYTYWISYTLADKVIKNRDYYHRSLALRNVLIDTGNTEQNIWDETTSFILFTSYNKLHTVAESIAEIVGENECEDLVLLKDSAGNDALIIGTPKEMSTLQSIYPFAKRYTNKRI